MDADKEILNKKIDRDQLFNKILKFCAYQERSENDVIEKLKTFKLNASETGKILKRLKEEKFIDNQRFARIYTTGKLRHNKWGRIRIRYELKRKCINNDDIEQALDSIDEDEYSQTLIELIKKKKGSIRDRNPFILRNKIAQYLSSKGFENDLVWHMIKIIIP
ncbi:MAG: RecX family transcriptional regulator [Cyclobacteriaceae bacterium]|nr:RecX family transcriptional regulator [Cyclobacteriaceae bacterium]